MHIFNAAAEFARGPWVKDLPMRDCCIAEAPLTRTEVQGLGWVPGRVPARFISRICRHLEGLEAARIWEAADTRRRHAPRGVWGG